MNLIGGFNYSDDVIFFILGKNESVVSFGEEVIYWDILVVNDELMMIFLDGKLFYFELFVEFSNMLFNFSVGFLYSCMVISKLDVVIFRVSWVENGVLFWFRSNRSRG